MKTKKEDGITLVKLVITIVILLVLAIVSIVLVNKIGFSNNDNNLIGNNEVIENVIETENTNEESVVE